MFAEKRARQKLSSSFADSQLDAIGCLPMILPFILLSASANEEQAVGDKQSSEVQHLLLFDFNTEAGRCHGETSFQTFDILSFNGRQI